MQNIFRKTNLTLEPEAIKPSTKQNKQSKNEQENRNQSSKMTRLLKRQSIRAQPSYSETSDLDLSRKTSEEDAAIPKQTQNMGTFERWPENIQNPNP